MKKLTLIVACAASLSLASCAGSSNGKTEAAPVDTMAEEVVAVDETDPEVAVLEITPEQKAALVNAKLMADDDFAKPVFIDFNATWCGPCRQFAPFFDEAAKKYGEQATFLSIDVDEYTGVTTAFGVTSIPNVFVILSTGEMKSYVGTEGLVGPGEFDTIVEEAIKG